MLFLALAVTGVIYIKTSASGIKQCTLNLTLGTCLVVVFCVLIFLVLFGFGILWGHFLFVWLFFGVFVRGFLVWIFLLFVLILWSFNQSLM